MSRWVLEPVQRLMWNPSLVGMVMLYAIHETHIAARYGGFVIVTAYVANIPILLALITSNVTGYTKRATALAIVFIGYCAGNIAGPQFFIESEAPKFEVC